MDNDLDIRSEMLDDRTVVHIKGEIDIYSAVDFKKDVYSLIKKGSCDMVIDCKGLKYIDSMGLGVFVSILKETRQNKCALKLINVKSNIMKLFSITGLDKIFDIEKEVIQGG